MIASRRHWDQLLADRLRTRAGRRSGRATLGALVVVAIAIALVPGVAVAQDYENPGVNGARLSVETADGRFSPVDYQFVRGIDFVANQVVQVFECPTSDPADPRVDCMAVGTTQSDADGAFEIEVPISGGIVTKDVYCAPIGTSQCHMLAGTYDPVTGLATSEAIHQLCFAEDFAWTFFPTQYFPERKPSAECDGPPDPTYPTTTTTTEPRWEPAAPLNVARQGLATTVGPDGRIYALGGSDAAPYIAGNALASAEVLDPCGTRTWSPIAPMPTARTDFGAATGPDGRIYVIGGRESNYTGTPLASVQAYDPATDTWSTVASLAVPRAGLAAATGADGRIYAIGGRVAGNAVDGYVIGGFAVPIVEAYDTATNKWTPVTPVPGNSSFSDLPLLSPESVGATTGPDGRVYAISPGPFGSGDSGLPAGTGPVQSYTPGPAGAPGIWLKEAAPSGQGFLLQPYSAVTTGPDGRIYDIGGTGGTFGSTRSVLVFDTDADKWTNAQETMATHRVRHAAAAGKDGRVYAVGGYEGDTLGEGQALASTEALKVAPSLCPSLPPVADFNGDRSTDIAVFRPANGVSFFRGQTPEAVAWGAEGDIPVPGDYNGDRQSDLAVFRPSNGVWYLRGQSPDALGWGTDGDIPVPADYDGDQKTDVAVFRPASGTWFIRQSSTGAELAANYGAPGDVPVPHDYDGDRKADLAVFRPSNSTWYLRGQTPDAIAYGAPGDVPVPADYDGDGEADLGIFRPSNGTWYLRPQTPDAIAYGANGDIPVPGDYDGDGRADLTVFRPANGTWYLENGQAIAWGIASDIPLPLPYAVRNAFF